ncbi:MAG: SDR family NAD(P)-dependent oxidoreductase [Acidimicrobiia bacterium]
MDLQLQGKRAIVTGGSKGIGKAIARVLAQEGVDVVIAARTKSTLGEAAAELSSQTGKAVTAITVDTGNDASVKAMVDAAVSRLGGIDILVNSAAKPAGQGRAPKLAEITDDAFYDDVNIKVMGYLRCAREVAPYLIENGWGRIINISGLGARQPSSYIGSMRNVAVAAMTKSLAEELGSQGINVTVVHPGLTRTEASATIFPAMAKARGVSVEDVERSLAAGNVSNRVVDASEVADVVAFLASPRSVAINGDAIAVGGGARGSIHY